MQHQLAAPIRGIPQLDTYHGFMLPEGAARGINSWNGKT